jgi:hypothetical protein
VTKVPARKKGAGPGGPTPPPAEHLGDLRISVENHALGADKRMVAFAVLDALEAAGVPRGDAVAALRALGYDHQEVTQHDLFRLARAMINLGRPHPAHGDEGPRRAKGSNSVRRGWKALVYRRFAAEWESISGQVGYTGDGFKKAFEYWERNSGDDENWIGVPPEIQKLLRRR